MYLKEQKTIKKDMESNNILKNFIYFKQLV